MRRTWIAALGVAMLMAARMPGATRAETGFTQAAQDGPDAIEDAIHQMFGTGLVPPPAYAQGPQIVFPTNVFPTVYVPLPGASPVPSLQVEDVVPIAGDSAPPQDEVMEEARVTTPRWFLTNTAARSTGVRWVAPAAASVTQTVAFFGGLHDGVVDMTIVSPEALPPELLKQVANGRLVLTPIDNAARKELTKSMASMMKKGSGAHVRRFKMAAYCVESQKAQPAADAMFTVADKAAAEQFAPMRSVRAVGEAAAAYGFLKPDSDRAAYGRFITQYAIWTKLDHWDQTRFTDEFVARSKVVFKADHKSWTNDTEATLRALAPHRWKDVQFVLRSADAYDKQQASPRGGVR